MATHPPTAIERAFELAKAGECLNISDIRTQLKIEGYAVSQITGPHLLRQLRGVIQGASAERERQSFSPLASD